MRRLTVVFVTALLVGALAVPAGARSDTAPPKNPVALGRGGAVATVDPVATEVGLAVLRRGGNAVDAAVAAAATLGVTEPYSAGIGGGGFMLIRPAGDDDVAVIDGREEAPDDARFNEDVFEDNTDGFFDAVNSGLSVGVPGTLATWVEALEHYGTRSLAHALAPAIHVADRGFVVDETFAAQTEANLDRFRQIEPTAELFLDDGEVPAIGSTFHNPDLADTYRLLAHAGPSAFYGGELAEEIVATVAEPPTTDAASEAWQPGFLAVDDIASYEVLRPDPTITDYRGYQVYGMPPPSSGGITVGETLNILHNARRLDRVPPVEFWHLTLEATAHAFADRNAYIGDDRFVDVPQQGLLADAFARERWKRIDRRRAADKPVPPGNPCPFQADPCVPAPEAVGGGGASTTHLVTADRWGTVVSYTLTIEQTGGSGITVPGRGFLLNNELTDFNFTGPSPNLPAPGKRPRSSMSPTIVLDHGDPFLAVGTPGGSTIITTVAEILLQRIDRGHWLPGAIASPRATQRNTTEVGAEPAFLARYGDALERRGHIFTEREEIGAATGIEFLGHGWLLAAAEPERRGGGDAGVVRGLGWHDRDHPHADALTRVRP